MPPRMLAEIELQFVTDIRFMPQAVFSDSHVSWSSDTLSCKNGVRVLHTLFLILWVHQTIYG